MRKLVVIALLGFALAAVAGCNSRNEGEAAETGGGGGAALRQSLESVRSGGSTEGAASGGGEDASAAPIGATVPEVGPQIVQTASLRLSVNRGRFDETIDEARSVAAGLGGFVLSSSASQGSVGRLVRGTLVVRIPARNYAAAVKALAALGTVESREEDGQDVSQEFVDLRARVRQLQSVESQLLELLDRADTVGAALAVQQQLSQVQLDLEQARGRLQYLDDQVAFATVSLAVHERLLPVENGGDDGFGVVEAWKKAAGGFVAVLGWTFVVLATVAPIVLILALVFLLARGVLGRRFPWPTRRPA